METQRVSWDWVVAPQNVCRKHFTQRVTDRNIKISLMAYLDTVPVTSCKHLLCGLEFLSEGKFRVTLPPGSFVYGYLKYLYSIFVDIPRPWRDLNRNRLGFYH